MIRKTVLVAPPAGNWGNRFGWPCGQWRFGRWRLCCRRRWKGRCWRSWFRLGRYDGSHVGSSWRGRTRPWCRGTNRHFGHLAAASRLMLARHCRPVGSSTKWNVWQNRSLDFCLMIMAWCFYVSYYTCLFCWSKYIILIYLWVELSEGFGVVFGEPVAGRACETGGNGGFETGWPLGLAVAATPPTGVELLALIVTRYIRPVNPNMCLA